MTMMYNFKGVECLEIVRKMLVDFVVSILILVVFVSAYNEHK